MDYSPDLIFIDPSRRTKNRKVVSFSDSEPKVVQIQSRIFERSKHLLIKASPLLDIKLGIKELKFVKYVFVVAIGNEVKELLFFAEKDFSGEPHIRAVNLIGNEREEFSFHYSEEAGVEPVFHDPQTWLYEPNAAILKAGAFKLLTTKFRLAKIHPSTHFYTSASLVKDFPGRVFKLGQSLKGDPKELVMVFPNGKANVITRNYPLTAEDLKRKSKLKDGGESYLLAFSGLTKKHLYQGTRVK